MPEALNLCPMTCTCPGHPLLNIGTDLTGEAYLYCSACGMAIPALFFLKQIEPKARAVAQEAASRRATRN